MDKSSPVFENFENKMAAMSGRPKINRSTFKIGSGDLVNKVANNEKKITTLKNIFKAQEPFGGNEDPLAEVNNTLEEIGVLLALDFSRREEIAKEELANQREEKAERKRSMKERMIEGVKGVGRKGMGAAKGAAGSVGDVTFVYVRVR